MEGTCKVKVKSTGHAISVPLFRRLGKLLNEVVQTNSAELEKRKKGVEEEPNPVHIQRMREGCIELICSSTIEAFHTLCQVRGQWHTTCQPYPA
jgi:hypothetical protein